MSTSATKRKSARTAAAPATATPAPEAPTPEASVAPAFALEISLAESWPWPGLVLRAAARAGERLLRLDRLRLLDDGFGDGERVHPAGAMDRMVVRTLLRLPTQDGITFRVPAGALAPVLVLLRKAAGCVRLRESARIAGLAILDEAPRPALDLRAVPGDATLRLHAAPAYTDAHGRELGLPRHRGETWWIFETAVAPAGEKLGDAALDKLFQNGPREVTGAEALALVRAAQGKRALMALTMSADIAAAAAAPPLKPGLRIESASGDEVTAELAFEGPGGACFDAEEVERAIADGSGLLRCGDGWARADEATLARARDGLKELGASAKGHNARAALGEDVPELLEAARELARQPESPWNVYVAQSVSGAHSIADDCAELRLALDVEDDGSEAWFRLSGTLALDGEPLTPEEVKRLMKQRGKWLRRQERWIRVDPEALEAFRKRAKHLGLRFDGNFPFAHRFRAAEREKVAQLFSLAGTVEHGERYRAFLEKLEGFERVEPLPPPASLRLPLRPYQLRGYQWMRFLARYGLNGILADDMGLGKTAQTIALLAAQREALGPCASLIVCPTSLVDNWCAEVLKFDGSLRVLRYGGGPKRRDRLRNRIADHDVVLTTYATARNDASLLKNEQWRYVILDEAHAIKNAAAATTKAIKTIPARHRLALSGTPIQNRLDELWSIFDFLMPGFLGRRAGFFRDYEEPIAAGQAPDAGKTQALDGTRAEARLRQRIRPFVLRRLKTDVAKELPEKIEQQIPCRLTADQAALYRKFGESDEARRAVREVEERGADHAQTQILAALTALRKICNHPDLAHLSREVAAGKKIIPLPGYEHRAGKLPVLGELLDQCREGGHRALIFCQLTSMLDILECFLHDRGVACLRLDGSTPGRLRQGLVDRFNDDPSIGAFLISTRAGGSGLNLTGADTVIFYDHDWNPANDRQAQDRAHRIGQTRTVNVYRLVSQGTLEEKILQRQARKQHLADAVVQHDSGGFKDLSGEDLRALFSYAPH